MDRNKAALNALETKFPLQSTRTAASTRQMEKRPELYSIKQEQAYPELNIVEEETIKFSGAISQS
ncbi:MAG TPA: hypothetical protein PKM21_11470 [Anaerolineales bacterium]|nr:hypothetical protein [Anaerolineales bacterium]